MAMTKNPSPTHNLQVFLGSLIRYAKLHYSLFGRINGELMQKPTKDVFNAMLNVEVPIETGYTYVFGKDVKRL